MTFVRLIALVAALAVSVVQHEQRALNAQQPDPPDRVVQLSVSVREGSRAVSGLTASDFTLADNDAPQTVRVSGLDRVPFDITLVVDSKGSTTGLTTRFASDIQQIPRALGTEDRLRIVRIDTFVEELRPMSRAAGRAAPVPARANGQSSLHDAIVAALIRPRELDRLHLVIAVTDGLDTFSVSTADRVREVATRSDALLEIVTVRPSDTPGGPLRPRFRDTNLLVLTEAAEQTGGALRGPGLFGDSALTSSVTRTLQEVRAGYLLSYSPEKVEEAGWHELSVAVPRAPNATVRVRRGYYAE
jgi:VWFA-related protein